MQQYDLYANNDPDSQAAYPYFVDIQTGLLADLNSRVVIPIVPASETRPYPKNLCPVVDINNRPYALLTHQVTTVSSSFLITKEGSLRLNRDDIIAALDFLLMGI
ncbi:CcdB family protein [Bacterioplanoides sp.]|uniref:CcdB family protein n=1 Tax=Bacterioplanoides sp. TaxID=2066072 RepID=UPI003B00AC03